jgi:hypothetical protein
MSEAHPGYEQFYVANNDCEVNTQNISPYLNMIGRATDSFNNAEYLK